MSRDLKPKQETMLAKADREQMYGDFDREDLTIPRLTVLQSTSPEVDNGLGKPGELFVKGQNRVLEGKEVEVIILFRFKSRLFWRKLDEGGGILCRADDGRHGVGTPGGDCATCALTKWNGKEKPKCDLNENIVVVLRGESDWIPMVVSGAKAKLKGFRELNNLLMVEMYKQRPLYGKSYTLRVKDEVQRGTGKKFFVYQFSTANKNEPLPQDEQDKAKMLYDRFKNVSINTEADVESEPAPSTEY